MSLPAVEFQGAVLVEHSEDAEAVVPGNWEGEDVLEGVSDANVTVGDEVEGALDSKAPVASWQFTNTVRDRFTLFFEARFL